MQTAQEQCVVFLKNHEHPTKMRSTTLLALISLLTLIATSCDSQQSKDREAIRDAVAEIQELPKPRPQDMNQVTIRTSKVVLFISTSEGTKDDNGRISFDELTIPWGSFMAPRIELVKNAE